MKSLMNENKQANGSRPARLVIDQPAEIDSFGAHGRIALAIGDLINHEDGGRTIALTGPYGSGKSTVVRLLEKNFSSAQRTFWVFDAWSHEGDPLRRTFLESLTLFLLDAGWLADEPKWQKELNKLAKRHKTTEINTHPKLSAMGLGLALSLLLTPLAATILSGAMRWGVISPGIPQNGKDAVVTIAVVLLLLPFVLAASKAFHAFVTNQWDSEKALADVGRVVMQKEGFSQQSDTFESSDPTSLEFERFFAALMRDALPEARKLVLVVDNLDRVDPDQAVRIWSTLRTFLDPVRAASKTAWLKQLWVLIPYDQTAIRRLWKGDANSEIVESAIEKSIQVSFQVPDIMLQDWRSYLASRLREAFPQHDDADLYPVLRLFASHQEQTRGTPTPRFIVTFVNALGAVYREHGEVIGLPVQAYYILIKSRRAFSSTDGESHTRIADALIAGDLPERAVRHHLGADASGELAALLFGKDLATAKQLLLSPPINSALANGDFETIRDLCRTHPHAWDVMEQVIERALADWTPAEGDKVLHAAFALNESGVLPTLHGTARSLICKQIVKSVQELRRFLPRTEAGVNGLLVVQEWASAYGLEMIGTKAISAAATAELNSGPNATQVVDSIARIKRAFDKVGIDLTNFRIEVPIPPAAMITLIEYAIDNYDSDVASVFVTAGSSVETLATFVKQQVETGKLTTQSAEAAALLLRTAGTLDAKPIADAAAERLNFQNSAAPAQVGALLTFLRSVGGAGEHGLRRLATQGHLHHHLHTVADDPHIYASLVAQLIRFRPDMELPAQVGNANAGQQRLIRNLKAPPDGLAERIVRNLAWDDSSQSLFDALRHNQRPLFLEALRWMVQGSVDAEVFTPERVIEFWPSLDAEAGTFLPKVVSDPFMDAVRQYDFDLRLGSLYAGLLTLNPSNAVFRGWIIDNFTQLTEEQLTHDFDSVTPRVPHLASSLCESGAFPDMSSPLRAALRKHAARIAGGGSPLANIQSMINLLSPPQKELLGDDIVDLIAERNGEVSDLLFDAFGDTLSLSPTLQRDDSRIVRYLIEPIVKRRDIGGLRWLARTMEQDPKAFKGLSKNPGEAFRNVILEALVYPAVTETDQILDHIRGLRKWHKPRQRDDE